MAEAAEGARLQGLLAARASARVQPVQRAADAPAGEDDGRSRRGSGWDTLRKPGAGGGAQASFLRNIQRAARGGAPAVEEAGQEPFRRQSINIAQAVLEAYKEETGVDLKQSALKKVISKHVMDNLLNSSGKGPERARPYDPKHSMRNLFAWKGTAMSLVVTKADFWILLCLHLFLQVVYNTPACVAFGHSLGACAKEGADDVDEEESGGRVTNATLLLLGSFVVFFLVFFNAEAYKRFFQEYFLCCKIRYAANTAFWLVRLHIQGAAKQHVAIRLLQAAVYLGYAMLAQNSELPGFTDHMFVQLKRMHCLTHAEVARLRAMEHGDQSAECLLWVMRELLDLMHEGALKPPIYRGIETQIVMIRNYFDEFRSFNEQPIPFMYYHLCVKRPGGGRWGWAGCRCADPSPAMRSINWCVEFYLAILAYVACFITPLWSILGYVGTLVALIGLREAAACLADPLGQDLTDIPVFLMATDMHFEQLYTVIRLGNRTPTPAPVPGWGGNDAIDALREGIAIDNFVRPHPRESEVRTIDEPKGILAFTGENSKFWQHLLMNEMPPARLHNLFANEHYDPKRDDGAPAARRQADVARSPVSHPGAPSTSPPRLVAHPCSQSTPTTTLRRKTSSRSRGVLGRSLLGKGCSAATPVDGPHPIERPCAASRTTSMALLSTFTRSIERLLRAC